MFDPEKGLLVNGKSVRIQGVNQHHDLGALGAAFNTRAAERQLQMLIEMGCNAIRFHTIHQRRNCLTLLIKWVY
jgi:beta-galactosidase